MSSLVRVVAAAQTNFNRHPKSVKFVTSDIENFWKAYDLAKVETDGDEMDRDRPVKVRFGRRVYGDETTWR